MRILFPIFIITTLIEIYTIIQVGEVFGGFATILLIILTAMLGSFLLKQQGLSTLQQAQYQVNNGISPTFEIISGVIIMISGILLLTPGFITDFIGLLGLLPFSRKLIVAKILTNNITKFSIFTTKYSFTRKNNSLDDTIDGEFW